MLTYEVDGEPRGVTVNSFSSISLDPPLVLVSLARKAKAASFLGEVPFCVNVLGASQVDVALNFAGRESERPIEWDLTGIAPRLTDPHAWLECLPWQSYDGGDHVLFLGEVQRLSFDESEPLLFYSGSFHWRGDELDERGRSRRLAGTPEPVDESRLRELEGRFLTGWL